MFNFNPVPTPRPVDNQQLTLKEWMKEKLSELLHTDVSKNLVDFLLSKSDDDIIDYLSSVLPVNSRKSKKFVIQLLRRRNATLLYDNEERKKVQAVKPANAAISGAQSEPETVPSNNTECADVANENETRSPSINKINVPTKETGQFIKNDESKSSSANIKPKYIVGKHVVYMQQPPKKHGRRKFVKLSLDKEEYFLMEGRYRCECEAKKHKLINNCESCGRIICEQEGSGPCFYCGNLVCTNEELAILNSGTVEANELYEKLLLKEQFSIGPIQTGIIPSEINQEDFEHAKQERDKLIYFDRNCASQTHVIDDRDYFPWNNVWLTNKEREEKKRQFEEEQDKKEAARYRLSVQRTVDITRSKIKGIDETGELANIRDPTRIYRDIPDEGDELPDWYLEQMRKAGINRKGAEPTTDIEALEQTSNWNNNNEDGSFNLFPDADADVDDDKSDIRNKNEPLVSPTHLELRDPDLYSFKMAHFSNDFAKANLVDEPCSHTQISRLQDDCYKQEIDNGFCLSVQQPFASLIISGIKKHEGRGWYTNFKGRLWIAAAKRKPFHEEIANMENFYRHIVAGNLEFPTSYPTGVILGCVQLVKCISQEEYKDEYPNGEIEDPFVFIFESPQEAYVKFPITGKSRIYALDPLVHKALKNLVDKSKIDIWKQRVANNDDCNDDGDDDDDDDDEHDDRSNGTNSSSYSSDDDDDEDDNYGLEDDGDESNGGNDDDEGDSGNEENDPNDYIGFGVPYRPTYYDLSRNELDVSSLSQVQLNALLVQIYGENDSGDSEEEYVGQSLHSPQKGAVADDDDDDDDSVDGDDYGSNDGDSDDYGSNDGDSRNYANIVSDAVDGNASDRNNANVVNDNGGQIGSNVDERINANVVNEGDGQIGANANDRNDDNIVNNVESVYDANVVNIDNGINNAIVGNDDDGGTGSNGVNDSDDCISFRVPCSASSLDSLSANEHEPPNVFQYELNAMLLRMAGQTNPDDSEDEYFSQFLQLFTYKCQQKGTAAVASNGGIQDEVEDNDSEGEQENEFDISDEDASDLDVSNKIYMKLKRDILAMDDGYISR